MLRICEIDKSYGATHAVKSVSIDVNSGTVLGLVGENGAGKSSLIKIVSGAIAPDNGTLILDKQTIAPQSTHDAMKLGIASVFQELTLVRELTVEQNLMLTNAPLTPWGSINRTRIRSDATAILKRYQLDISPQARVEELSLGQQQMVEIVRAVERHPKILLLDEATSALGATEVEWLVQLVKQLSDDGKIVLFISHRWDEIVQFCTRVAVLRNGELVATADTKSLTENEAVRLMSGHETFEDTFPPKHPAKAEVTLTAKNMNSTKLHDVSLELSHGEILGLGGLIGQGQGHLLETFFGAHQLISGTIDLNGTQLIQLTPRRAIRSGIAYVPQERKTEGLLLDKSVSQNITLAIINRLESLLTFISPRKEGQLVQDAITRAQILTTGGSEPVRNLSGGNQQKVLLEKWLLTKPTVLLLNDVTRGVDIGTKHQIYEVITEIAKHGVSVIWYSTDARELVGIAHRILVMLQGRVTAELTGSNVTVKRIIHAAVMGANQSLEDETCLH